MAQKHADFDPCEVQSLILRSLVRKLVEKRVLSENDVRSLLQNAVEGLHSVVPNARETKAANDIIIEGS